MNRLEQSSVTEHSTLEKLLSWGGMFTVIFLASFAAFSKKQRESILDRDSRRCNYPLPHDCGGDLCVHQIIPPRYAKVVGLDPDYPENALTICKNIQAGPNGIFPDIAEAQATYAQNPDSFKQAILKRAKKLAKRQIYWNPAHDREMNVMAAKNTQQAEKQGWEFPTKKTRKKALKTEE